MKKISKYMPTIVQNVYLFVSNYPYQQTDLPVLFLKIKGSPRDRQVDKDEIQGQTQVHREDCLKKKKLELSKSYNVIND
jgi:hypothetical protein